MSGAQRLKGRRAEAEVAAIFRDAGFTVHGLEGAGDHSIVGHGLTLHSEVKRQETLRLPLWTRQAESEAPEGAIPAVFYRRNRTAWRALVPALLTEEDPRLAPLTGGIHYSLRSLNGRWWADFLLADLVAWWEGR